jgi:hypothetical protein
MAEKKKTAPKKAAEKKKPSTDIVAQVIMPDGVVKLSDGGRTSATKIGTDKNTGKIFDMKVGDKFVKNADGSYKKA